MADVATWTCSNANWAYTDPRKRLHGVNAKRVELIGPMGKVGPREIKGGHTRPSGRHKPTKRFFLL